MTVSEINVKGCGEESTTSSTTSSPITTPTTTPPSTETTTPPPTETTTPIQACEDPETYQGVGEEIPIVAVIGTQMWNEGI